jgi:membrane protein
MKFKAYFQKLKRSLTSFYHRMDDFSGGVVEILRVAFQRFAAERGSEASASMAYYTLFSIFPMLLALIVIGSFFVDRTVVQNQLLNVLQGIIPGVEEVIIGNIEQVLQLRGAVSFFALVSLTWSATSVFNILVKNINRAFPKAAVPDFFKGRLMGFYMILFLITLMLVSFGVSTLSGLVPAIKVPLNDRYLHETLIWQIGGFLVPIGFNFLMFWALYYWVPTVKVERKASILGALVAGVAWELLNNAFTWYLSSGFSQYRLVYGSVGMIVAFLFWIYLTATIMLLGAHLTASIQMAMVHHKENEKSA